MSQCRSCGKPIIWTVTAVAGRAMPLDAQPVENGNIIIRDGIACVSKEKAEGELMYISHFATCIYAKRHRNPKPKKEAPP